MDLNSMDTVQQDQIKSARPRLSVVIVSYNVRAFLEQALISIEKALTDIAHDVYVVDNASSDGSADMVAEKFPAVILIRNRHNVGFARANNQAIRRSRAEVVCLINPDTLVQEDTFSTLLGFLDNTPDAGAVGCKVLNPDGTLQLACRRSYPTPWVAFTKMMGLASLFPKSRWFGQYNLTYLDPDRISEVDAISGSFMMVRRKAIRQVGALDEGFFMYGEDLDWCYRIRKGGWGIYYVPRTQIIHFKGESSKKSPFEQRRLFYDAMAQFVKKHFSTGKALIPLWVLIIAIWMRAALDFGSQLIKVMILPAVDVLFFTISLAAALFLRFYPDIPWNSFVVVHLLYTSVWLVSFSAHGLYGSRRFSGSQAALAVIVGWLVNSVLTYFIRDIAFSRAVVLYAGAVNLVLMPLWRVVISRLNRLGRFRGGVLGVRAVLVGDVQSLKTITQHLSRRLKTYPLVGMIITDPSVQETIGGYPVLGSLNNINDILQREEIDEVIFATDKMDYHQLLTVIASSPKSSIHFKLIPSEMDVMIGKASIDYLSDLPFVDLDYRLHRSFYRDIKRLLDVIVSGLGLIVLAPAYVWLRWIRKRSLVPLQTLTVDGDRITLYIFDGPSGTWWCRLPLLRHVFSGTLSLVGRDLKPTSKPLSLSLKPGLTGVERLGGDTDLTASDRERYHIYYLKNYTPLLDLEILIKTLLSG
jgi:hypothetical protein